MEDENIKAASVTVNEAREWKKKRQAAFDRAEEALERSREAVDKRQIAVDRAETLVDRAQAEIDDIVNGTGFAGAVILILNFR